MADIASGPMRWDMMIPSKIRHNCSMTIVRMVAVRYVLNEVLTI